MLARKVSVTAVIRTARKPAGNARCEQTWVDVAAKKEVAVHSTLLRKRVEKRVIHLCVEALTRAQLQVRK